MPYCLKWSAMAESPDGRGVLLFGGFSCDDTNKPGDPCNFEDRILELRAGANSWTILNITLQNGRRQHTVIPLQ